MRKPGIEDILTAAARISPLIHRTPVLTCGTLDALTGAKLYFKCENLQKVGAFKFRGAANAVFSLGDDEVRKGVATHSSGNHAQALALAARMKGVPAHIVMPENAPRVKVEAVRGYGARIVFCAPGQKSREETLGVVVAETGAAFIPPYNDLRVITGQATCALELIDEVNDLDIVMTPVGGGGLLSGTALSVHYLSPSTMVIAGEPAGADDALRSFRSGKIVPSVNPQTIADGLLTSLGDLTFPIIREHVSDIITAREETIIETMKLVWERMKIVVEPSGVVPLAALIEKKEMFAGKRVGIVFSGGNVDLTKLPWFQQPAAEI